MLPFHLQGEAVFKQCVNDGSYGVHAHVQVLVLIYQDLYQSCSGSLQATLLRITESAKDIGTAKISSLQNAAGLTTAGPWLFSVQNYQINGQAKWLAGAAPKGGAGGAIAPPSLPPMKMLGGGGQSQRYMHTETAH